MSLREIVRNEFEYLYEEGEKRDDAIARIADFHRIDPAEVIAMVA